MAGSQVLRSIAVLAAVVFIAGCGSPGAGETTAGARKGPPAPVSAQGEAARAVGAVAAFAHALRDGDVELLCRPGAVFTPAVVTSMNSGGDSCEASLERSDALEHPPTMIVTGLAFEPGLARTRVSVGGRSAIPLDVVRSGRRWLVSFSDGADPVAAVTLAQAS